tara:strand:+ start:48 stop:446 length:399 start_codon:yes stop_codon:yes gene_type:complete
MAARLFPALAPTSRTFTPGTFPQTVFEAQNGATTVMRYSNKLVNTKLSLTFANISDAQTETIIAHYVNVNSDWDHVTFTDSRGLQGMGSGLRARNEGEPDGLRWRYMEPPQVTSVQPGISTVQCKFCAYLDG